MPAYFFLIVGVLVAGAVLFLHGPYARLGAAALSSSVFSSNIYFMIFYGGYFDPGSEENPLLNLWSLSVEEQFYIIVPVILLIVWRFWRRGIFWTLLVTAVISFLIAVASTAAVSYFNNPLLSHRAAFYLLTSRAWELCAGALLIFLPEVRKPRLGAFFACLGVLLIAVPYALYTKETLFPGAAAVPFVLGTMLLIRYGALGMVGKLLCSSGLVGIGKISYSLYLWHWPVFVFWKYTCGEEITIADYSGMMLVSFAMAYISYRWVETPIRKNKTWFKPRVAFCGVVGFILVIFCVSSFIVGTNGCANYLHKKANELSKKTHWRGTPYTGATITNCPDEFPLVRAWFAPRKEFLERAAGHLERITGSAFSLYPEEKLFCVGDANKINPTFLLIGDSHAMSWTPGLDQLCRENGISGVIPRCIMLPLTDCPVNGSTGDCWTPPQTEKFMAWMKMNPSFKTVVMADAWGFRIHRLPILDDNGNEVPLREKDRLAGEALKKTCRNLKAMGVKVVLIEPVPFQKKKVLDIVALRCLRGIALQPDDYSVAENFYREMQGGILNAMAELEAEGTATIIRVQHLFLKNGRHMGMLDGKILYLDDNHLNHESSVWAIEKIGDSLIRALQ